MTNSTEPKTTPRSRTRWPYLLLGIGLGLFFFFWWYQPEKPPLPPLTQDQAVQMLHDLQHDLERVITRQDSAYMVMRRLRELTERAPNYVEAYNSLAQAQLYASQPRDAYETLMQSLALEPNQPEMWLTVGTLALGDKRVHDAIDHYRQASNQAPESPRYREYLAVAYERQGDFETADEVLAEILRQTPTRASTWAQRAELAALNDQFALAIEYLTVALQNTSPVDARQRRRYEQRLAQWHLAMNQPDEALAILQAMSAKHQFEHETASLLASAWDAKNEAEKAAWHYQQMFILDPTDELAAEKAAYWHLKAGQIADAQRHIQALSYLNPRHPELPVLQTQLDDTTKVD